MCFAAMKWIQYWKAKLTNKKMLTINFDKNVSYQNLLEKSWLYIRNLQITLEK